MDDNKLKQALVSIIMPAYNAQSFIAESINSVIEQTYTNWELIIVDDGSTDDTSIIAKKFVLKDTRIKYLFQQNGKQGKARNLGIKNCAGRYIAFLDADDLWVNTKLLTQVETLEDRPDIDLIFSRGSNFFPDGTITEVNIKVQEWSWQKDARSFIKGNQIPILSVMVRREALLSVDLFTEDVRIQNAEDYHLWLKMLKQHRFLSIPDKLFYYRIHQDQATYQDSSTQMPIAYCLFDLVNEQVIDKADKTVQQRLKWLIFQTKHLDTYLNDLSKSLAYKNVFVWVLKTIAKISPDNTLLKKIAFHAL